VCQEAEECSVGYEDEFAKDEALLVSLPDGPRGRGRLSFRLCLQVERGQTECGVCQSIAEDVSSYD
jgi:hypothetical protein